MSALRRTLATTCMLCLFTLSGFSVSRGADAGSDWLTYNRTLEIGSRLSRKSTVPTSPN